MFSEIVYWLNCLLIFNNIVYVNEICSSNKRYIAAQICWINYLIANVLKKKVILQKNKFTKACFLYRYKALKSSFKKLEQCYKYTLRLKKIFLPV